MRGGETLGTTKHGAGRRSGRSRRAPFAALRTALGLTSLGIAMAAAAALMPGAAAASADGSPIGVDRQAYVNDVNPGADPYSGEVLVFGNTGQQDSIDTHVAASATQATYTTFVHLEIEAIPAGTPVESLVLTLVPTTDPTRYPAENTNTSAAVLNAYPLKTELQAKYDPNNAPAPDTSGPAVVGKVGTGKACDANGNCAWTFDLAPLLPYWKEHGNTGAAIVPVPASPTQWSIGFDRSLSVAQATYGTVPPPAPAFTEAPVPAPIGTTFNPPPAPPVSSPAPSPVVAASPSPAPVHKSSTPAPAPTGTQWWLIVLASSLAASVALLAQPVSQALGSAGGAMSGLATQFALHPRMFAVAGVLLLWSTTFGIYANSIGKTALNPSVASADQGSPTSGTEAGAGGSTSTPGASADQTGSVAQGSGGSVGSGGSGSGNGSVVSYPGSPNPPSASLYSGADETVGLTDNAIHLCAHAALTFGPAFNIGASDLNVYWQMVNDQGGIWGRKLLQPDGSAGIPFQDDGYQPSKAVTAAQACHDQAGGDFFLLGGIGFDQIPAVRVWAEQNHMIYIHHIATQQGTQGLRYSYTMLPTLEVVGDQFAEFYLSRYASNPNLKKLGIIYRNSSNWQPGLDHFLATLNAAGVSGNVVDEEAVTNNQSDYSAQITKMQARGAQTILIWENALAGEQIIQQASGQQYNPAWIMFPFNLTLQTLEQAKVDVSRIDGLIPWPAYTCNASNDPRFAPYKAEIQKFEAAYAKYDSGANLCGDGGDLLFGTWLAWEQVYDLLYQCGRDCTRDKIAGLMLNGYHAAVGANCPVDFRGTDGHHGGIYEDIYHVGHVGNADAWYNTAFCQKTIT